MSVSFTTRCLLIGMALLLSALVGVGGAVLHRNDGASISAAILQGGKTFAGALTVCMSVLMALGLLL